MRHHSMIDLNIVVKDAIQRKSMQHGMIDLNIVVGDAIQRIIISSMIILLETKLLYESSK